MATCKDCFHFEVCDSGRHIGEYELDDGVYTEGVENECLTFKPTADVAEVKHGEWEAVHIQHDGYAEVYYNHKECKISPNELYKSPFEHCPRCGAKMDE